MIASRTRPDWGKYLALIALAALLLGVLYPFAIIAINAVKTPIDYASSGPLSLPKEISFQGLIDFWNRVDFTTKLVNSFTISLTVAIFGVGLSLLNAFALGIGNLKGKYVFLVLFMLANTLPQESLA